MSEHLVHLQKEHLSAEPLSKELLSTRHSSLIGSVSKVIAFVESVIFVVLSCLVRC